MAIAAARPLICFSCRLNLLKSLNERTFAISSRRLNTPEPTHAPKANFDLPSIRKNPELHFQNCKDRNYQRQSSNAFKIADHFVEWRKLQEDGKSIRERINSLEKRLANPKLMAEEFGGDVNTGSNLIMKEAKTLKLQIADLKPQEDRLLQAMKDLASQLPNLTSPETPIGDEPSQSEPLGYTLLNARAFG